MICRIQPHHGGEEGPGAERAGLEGGHLRLRLGGGFVGGGIGGARGRSGGDGAGVDLGGSCCSEVGGDGVAEGCKRNLGGCSLLAGVIKSGSSGAKGQLEQWKLVGGGFGTYKEEPVREQAGMLW